MAKAPKNYLNNENLIIEIVKSQKTQKKFTKRSPGQCLTPELVNMLILLVNRYSKSRNWNNYSYLEDMKSEALVSLCQNALKFDIEKSQNPFGYYTTLITNSFLSFMEKEKRQRNIRDDLIETHSDGDILPSFTRQSQNETANQLEQDLDGTKRVKANPWRFRKRKNALFANIPIPTIDSEPVAPLDEVLEED